jgi:hypothetical protein
MTVYELVREGVWTTNHDGRLLTPGTTTWHDEKIPLLAPKNDGPEGRFESEIVGFVYNIHRVGNRILGETDYELRDDQTLTCDCDKLGETTEHEGLGIEFAGARIRAAWIDPKDKYPWKDEEEKEVRPDDGDDDRRRHQQVADRDDPR